MARGKLDMTAMKIFSRKSPNREQVSTGSFEIERDGQVASLAYSLSGNVLGLIHTEVPEALRGMGLATTLAETGLKYAHEHHLKVDVICPSVQHYLSQHPEYQDLVLK